MAGFPIIVVNTKCAIIRVPLSDMYVVVVVVVVHNIMDKYSTLRGIHCLV